MSYHYYGGTRGSSPERILADIQWQKKHYSHEDWKKEATASKRFLHAIVVVAVMSLGLCAFGLLALAVWGIKNLCESGFSWQILLFNPITIIACLVGCCAFACRK